MLRHTMARNCWLALLLVVAAVLCPRGLMAAEFPPDDGMRELTLATVSPEVSAVEAQMEPILAAANRILAADNIRLELRVFGTYTSLVWQMWDEGFDLIIDQTLMALNIMRDTSSRPLGAVTRPGGPTTPAPFVPRSAASSRRGAPGPDSVPPSWMASCGRPCPPVSGAISACC